MLLLFFTIDWYIRLFLLLRLFFGLPLRCVWLLLLGLFRYEERFIESPMRTQIQLRSLGHAGRVKEITFPFKIRVDRNCKKPRALSRKGMCDRFLSPCSAQYLSLQSMPQ